jgi:abortive infection bacteriophage resistance protein
MKPNYTKTCTLPQNLIPLLHNRGLHIADEQKAIDYLTHIGYFRFSAYLYPLLQEPKNEHCYKSGATFEMALNMYRFDRKLRTLLFNEIEKIEVAIRSAMNNYIRVVFFAYILLVGSQILQYFFLFHSVK